MSVHYPVLSCRTSNGSFSHCSDFCKVIEYILGGYLGFVSVLIFMCVLREDLCLLPRLLENVPAGFTLFTLSRLLG